MDVVSVPSLRWSLTPDDEARVKLEALAVETLTANLAARNEVMLEGEQGHKLVLRPGRKKTATWAHGEQILELAYGKRLADAMCSSLGPWCGEYAWLQLPKLSLEVVESKVTDPKSGKVVKVVGWEGKPLDARPVTSLVDAITQTPKEPARRPKRRRWGLRALLALLLLAPLGLLGAAFVHLRHVPYTIPEAYRAPAPNTQLSAALGMGIRIRWLGISGYEISDGKTIVLTDPVFTRPTLSQLLTGPIQVDPEASAEIKVADYILINHAHYDHAADLPVIAKRTGAVVLGSRSALNLCRSRGVPEKQLREVYDGQHLKLGTFDVIVRQTVHTAIAGIDDPMSGTIPTDAGPLWFWEYTNDGTFAYRLQANGTSLWFHPTSTLYQGEKELWPAAKNLILGVTGEPFTRAKLKTMLDACQPRWVFPTHYDNFFFPRSEGLALMPEADLAKVGRLVEEYDPKIELSVLDFEQTVYLPPD